MDRDGDMVWMADWVDGRYVYGYNRKTGRYITKVHHVPYPSGSKGIFMVGGRMLISADDGDADLDEPDNLYVADLRDGKSPPRCFRSARWPISAVRAKSRVYRSCDG